MGAPHQNSFKNIYIILFEKKIIIKQRGGGQFGEIKSERANLVLVAEK